MSRLSAGDPRRTWWFWSAVQKRLATWTKALLQGRKYTVRLEAKGTGYTDWENRVVKVNPGLWPEENVRTQFRATQGILAHEVGHVLFTTGWAALSKEPTLAWLVNALEDERIERAISVYYPGVAAAVRLAGDLSWRDTLAAQRESKRRGRVTLNAHKMLALCLAWRWAKTRSSEKEMLAAYGVNAKGRQVWGKIRPLVESAWNAHDTETVIAIAREILNVLDIRPGEASQGIKNETVQKKPKDGSKGEGNPLSFPDGAFEGPSPGLGKGLGEDSLPDLRHRPSKGDPLTDFSPYADLEARARPDAKRLAEAIKIPQPRVRTSAHEWRGRYTFRQELRTPDTPNRVRSQIGRSSHGAAFYILVDRSGSMSHMDEAVQYALMVVYLALTEAGVPTGIAYFGHRTGIAPERAIFEVSPVQKRPDEVVKSLIAGFHGSTGAEFLHWGLLEAERSLERRPERRKFVLAIHDGMPVYNGRHGVDKDLSIADVERLERKGIIPLGIFLGGETYAERLREIFPRIVATPASGLANKLAEMLRSLIV